MGTVLIVVAIVLASSSDAWWFFGSDTPSYTTSRRKGQRWGKRGQGRREVSDDYVKELREIMDGILSADLPKPVETRDAVLDLSEEVRDMKEEKRGGECWKKGHNCGPKTAKWCCSESCPTGVGQWKCD